MQLTPSHLDLLSFADSPQEAVRIITEGLKGKSK